MAHLRLGSVVSVLTGLVLSVGLLVPTSDIHAATESCSVLEKAWTGRYSDAFHANETVPAFACDGGIGILSSTIADLEALQLDADGQGYRPDFYQIVTSRIKVMAYDAACTALARTSRALGRITICPSFFTDNREDRASTLVHESRHIDADDPGHVTCTGGKRIGRAGACDDTFYNGEFKGSGYNLDVFFLSWVKLRSRGNELSKSVAQSQINSFVPDTFNNITAAQTKAWRDE